MAAALAVREQLWESGRLPSAMTETEKARVYYTWICENCTYDYDAGDKSLSHIELGAQQVSVEDEVQCPYNGSLEEWPVQG